MPKKETGDKTVRVTLVRSPIGYTKDQKADCARTGSAPHASDCGTQGYSGFARHDPQDHSSRSDRRVGKNDETTRSCAQSGLQKESQACWTRYLRRSGQNCRPWYQRRGLALRRRRTPVSPGRQPAVLSPPAVHAWSGLYTAQSGGIQRSQSGSVDRILQSRMRKSPPNRWRRPICCATRATRLSFWDAAK